MFRQEISITGHDRGNPKNLFATDYADFHGLNDFLFSPLGSVSIRDDPWPCCLAVRLHFWYI